MKRASLLLALGLAAPAFAHDTWIVPDRFTGACGAVTLHMTSAEGFGKLDYAIEPGRVARAIAATPGRRLNLTPERAAHSLDFRLDVPKGTTIVAIDLAPKTLELTPAQVDEYLEEISAPDDVRAAWKAHRGRWRERYTKHAKTFVRCGKSDGRFQTGVGMGFELVPQGTDPTSLKAGDTLKVALIDTKHLVRDVAIVLVREGSGPVAVVKPPESGVASVVVPLPGRYMLSATRLRRGNGNDDVDWVSDFTTLTFSVE
jgi:Domain of unknown function (DUF4198)